MNSAEKSIEWVLRFVEMDLDNLRQGDWLNLEEDVRAFVQRPANWPLMLKQENLPALQREAKAVLQSIAFANAQPPEQGLNIVSSGIRKKSNKISYRLSLSEADVALTFELQEPGSFPLRFQSRILRDVFLYQLAVALSGIDSAYLRQCSVCSRLFLADHGRQQFCSAKCKGKAASKRFRERHREELKEKAHELYTRKLRIKVGRPTQRVDRRRKP